MAKKVTKFDFRTIKTFEDACKHLKIDSKIPEIPGKHAKALIAAYKLMIIYEAINNGWQPDWNNYNQNKYYPWFRVLSSGFCFSFSNSDYAYACTSVGSRLCTDTSAKALYIAKQFEAEYKDFFLYTK